jgi:hypothetical protein
MNPRPVSSAVAEMFSRAISSTPVPSLLAHRSAVVLERIARGAGSTRWYLLTGIDQLPLLAGHLRPGSAVSFYFDDRIERRDLNDDTVDLILDLIHAEGSAVLGVLSPDGMTIEVDFPSGIGEMTEFLGARTSGVSVFVGAFPGRDNDGLASVTLDLPDSDGVVRRHPH